MPFSSTGIGLAVWLVSGFVAGLAGVETCFGFAGVGVGAGVGGGVGVATGTGAGVAT